MTDVGSCTSCGRRLDVPSPSGLCPDCLRELQRAPTGLITRLTATRHPGQIGRYRILSTLGEGGMGIVYLAEQTEPVRRRVAVKVIKVGMDTADVVARFEAERQTLASMDHPNIAVVFDAGATPQGRPFFVMEYVEGLALTQFCDMHRLSTKARLGTSSRRTCSSRSPTAGPCPR